MNLIFSFYYYS